MTAILNDITHQYQAATMGWYNYLFPIANHIFASLAVIEIALSGISWTIEKHDISSLWMEFLKRILFIGFFYAVLLHANVWIPAIIKSFMLIGSGASHITKLDPTSIFEQGMSIANSVLIPLEKKSILTDGFAFVIGSAAALIVALSFAVIAGELVVTLVESYLVVGAGILFLGFGSSRWTTSFATKFLNYALSVGCKLFFLYLIVGVGANLAQEWKQMIIEGGYTNMTPFLEVIGGSLVFVFITWTIPNKASSLLSGTFNSSFAGLLATTNLVNTAVKTVFKANPLTNSSLNARHGIESVRKINNLMHKERR
jgi:type IV secretion system protein TrbL